MSDPAEGYEAAAAAFVAARSAAGSGVVRAFARRLPPGAEVLDIGAGFGWPVTDELVAAGHRVVAIEPAPSLAKRLAERLPTVRVRRERAEAATLGDAAFDAAVMIGVIFLLPEETQRTLLARTARALRPGGQLLLSAPWQAGRWTDMLTGRPSRSLGGPRYEEALSEAGLSVAGRHLDEGGSHYFEARAAPESVQSA